MDMEVLQGVLIYMQDFMVLELHLLFELMNMAPQDIQLEAHL
jgi:hypothetical protein